MCVVVFHETKVIIVSTMLEVNSSLLPVVFTHRDRTFSVDADAIR